MSYELSKGSLFATIGDTTMTLGEGIPFTEEVELSAKETLTRTYSTSMEFEMGNVNWELFNNLFNTPLSDGKFNMEYFIPIMIQARWHKKPRIRKKWLKRFGMKPDTVKVRTDATALEYHPGHILDEQYDDNGICATFGSFEFETNNQEYLWRPDQKRKGLKIEF